MTTLITETEEVKLYASVNASLKINDLLPSIKSAQNRVVKPLLGSAQMTSLEEYYQDSESSSSTDEHMDDLLELAQEAIAVVSLINYLNFGTVLWDSAGVKMDFSGDRKPAFQWAIENLRQSLVVMADEAINSLLEYLEGNADHFPLWKESDAYTSFKELFVQTTDQFQKYFNINSSRTTFVALKPAMREIEDFYIKPALCGAYFEELKEKTSFIDPGSSSASVDGDAINEDDKIVLDLIRKAVVPLTITKAVKYLPVQWSNNGIVVKRIAGIAILKEEPAVTEQLSAIQNEMEKTGNAYLEELKRHLNENASETKYQTYFESPCYVDPNQVPDPDQPRSGGPYNSRGFTMV